MRQAQNARRPLVAINIFIVLIGGPRLTTTMRRVLEDPTITHLHIISRSVIPRARCIWQCVCVFNGHMGLVYRI